MKKLFIAISILFAASSFALTAPAAAAPAEIESSAAAASVRTFPGAMEISVNGPAQHFLIYSITGQLVKSLTVAEGSCTVELPRGCYIVKCQSWSKKVVVK